MRLNMSGSTEKVNRMVEYCKARNPMPFDGAGRDSKMAVW